MESIWINDTWASAEYQEEKKKNFEVVTRYLKSPPTKLLDIGCGLAWESRMFGNQFNTELWLVDGDAENNKDKDSNSKETKWHASTNSFLFYHTIDLLDTELKKLETNIKNYITYYKNNDDDTFDFIDY